jgi:hypothetical protein
MSLVFIDGLGNALVNTFSLYTIPVTKGLFCFVVGCSELDHMKGLTSFAPSDFIEGFDKGVPSALRRYIAGGDGEWRVPIRTTVVPINLIHDERPVPLDSL